MGTLFFAAGILLYFLPTLLGAKKRNAGAIFALNFFLGWTFVGWVVALIWALTVDKPIAQPAMLQVSQFCSACRAPVSVGQRFCHACGASLATQLMPANPPNLQRQIGA
jgi:Superinfection immunity protein/zinc-ribbon domain